MTLVEAALVPAAAFVAAVARRSIGVEMRGRWSLWRFGLLRRTLVAFQGLVAGLFGIRCLMLETPGRAFVGCISGRAVMLWLV